MDADRAARRDWLAQAIALRLDEDDREALAHIPQLLTKLVE
ncbi:hypothetical protein GCM10027614_79170 [Micromonospora vulcania]